MSHRKSIFYILLASSLMLACTEDSHPNESPEQKEPDKTDPDKTDPDKTDPDKTDPSQNEPEKKAVCGNGIREDGEVCDGKDGVPESCQAYQGDVTWISGTPACAADCSKIVEGTCVEGSPTLIAYPAYPEDIMPRDYDYKVRVIQGNKSIELPVYNPVYQPDASSMGQRGNWHRRYSEFAFSDAPVTIEVTVNLDFDTYTIMPSSRQIPSEIHENVITWQLDHPQTTMLRVTDNYDSDDTILTIFAEAPEDISERPDPSDPNVHYFAAGYHEVEGGVLHVENGHTIYLEPGALVAARLYLKNDIKVFGRGAFIEPGKTRMPVSDQRYGCTIAGQNVSLKDIRILDTRDFVIVVSYADHVELDGIKCLANQISTDGFSIWGKAHDVHVHDSFWHVNDNIYVLSGENQNVIIERNIIGSDHAMFFPQKNVIGGRITIRDIDIFRAGSILKSTYNPEKADRNVDDFHLENIYAEDAINGAKFIWMSEMGGGAKNYSMINVSAPKPTAQKVNTADDPYQITIASGMKDVTFNIDNVWVNGKPFKSKDDLKIYSPEPSNRFIFSDRSDATSAFAGMRNVKTLEQKWIAPKVKIGAFLVECKVSPIIQNDVVYVSLLEIIQQLEFTDIQWDEHTLSFKDLNGKTHQVTEDDKHFVKDHRMMVPLSFFEETLGNKAEWNDKTKTAEIHNIERKGNLLKNPGIEEGLTYDWVTHNYAKLYLSEDAHSGKNSIRIVSDSSPENGISQGVHDILRQYGPGKYRFSAWVKQNLEKAKSQNISIGLSSAFNFSSTKLNHTIKLTSEWQKIEYEYELESPEKLRFVLFYVGYVSSGSVDFLVDDLTMEKIE